MTPADKRVLETIDRWLRSLETHLKYAQLDDAAYSRIQDWPKHDRPTRWVLELARQRTLQLKTQCEARIGANDEQFSEALELMSFLANLLGSQHLERFIPFADPAKENASEEGTAEHLRPAARDNDSTREMPRPKPAGQSERPPSQAPKTIAAAAVKTSAAKPQNKPRTQSHSAQDTVIADAVRLLKWGRKWHELAELIARMAERPAVGEVRKILRERKSEIEALCSA